MRRAMLSQQTFAGNCLVRGIAGKKMHEILGADITPGGTLFTLVADRRVAVADPPPRGSTADSTATSLCWLDREGLASLDILYPGTGEQLVVGDQQAPVYFLGEDVGQQSLLRLAVDVSALPAAALEQRRIRLQDLRSLLPLLPAADLAIAGHAMALSQWHQAHLFCSRCGAPSTSVDGGARRQCTAHPAHRQYPRTDPVVIMLVESPDGRSALLGRSKKMRGGMLTCLSGFVDQGESIEEAVCRETREEAGVEVVAVDIVGSQPWPVGRGGSCELMIGCIAKAAGSSIAVDPEEMEEVCWVAKADVAEAVAQSDSPDSPYYGGSGGGTACARRLSFFVPPPIAIAHHLLRQWCQNEGPWFTGEQHQDQHQLAPAPAAALAAAAAGGGVAQGPVAPVSNL